MTATYTVVAENLRLQNRRAEVPELWREAITYAKENYGDTCEDVARYTTALARTLLGLGEVAVAEPLAREGLALRGRLAPTALSASASSPSRSRRKCVKNDQVGRADCALGNEARRAKPDFVLPTKSGKAGPRTAPLSGPGRLAGSAGVDAMKTNQRVSRISGLFTPALCAFLAGCTSLPPVANTVITPSGGPTLFTSATPGERVPPVPKHTVAPALPPELRRLGVSGLVTVSCLVDETGRVGEPKVVESTDPALEEPALAAIQQWRFEPGRNEGRPIVARVTIPLQFSFSR